MKTDRRQFIRTTGAAAALVGVTPSFTFSNKLTILPASDIIKSTKERIKPIAKEERLARLEKARVLMKENKMDVLFVEGGTSLNYYTGISWWRSERLFAMMLFQAGDPIYVAPKFEEGRAAEQTGDAKIFTWEEDESPYVIIKKVLQEKGLLTAVVGVEETTRFFIPNDLQKECPALKLQSANAVTAGCRSVKSNHEIELIQIANNIAAEVYKSSVAQLKEGMSENEYGGIVSKGFAEFGVRGGAMVLFGEASAYPHGMQKEHTLKQGDIVLMDGGCTVEGYHSDITRTVVFGKPTDKMHSIFSIVQEAQQAAFKIAKLGVPAEEIDRAARKVIESKGYGKFFTHRLGHGIGMDEHEWYYLVGGSKRPVQPGNMFSRPLS